MTTNVAPPILHCTVGQRCASLLKVARNDAADSENRIHDDDEARRYGLRGALVPGVTVYAHLTELALSVLGPDWLAHGRSSARFRRPVYEGEQLECVATLAARSGGEEQGEAELELEVFGPDRVVRVTGTAGVRWGDSPAESIGPPEWTAAAPAAAPEQRPILTAVNPPLDSPVAPLYRLCNAQTIRAYVDAVDDPNPWFRDGSPWGVPVVPLGLLAGQPARALRQAFSYGPSVHTASEIEHLWLPLADEQRPYRVDERIVETFRKGADDYLVAEVAITSPQEVLVVRIRHTSIFAFAPRN